MDRRSVLQAGGALAAGGVLAACSGGTTAGPAGPQPAAAGQVTTVASGAPGTLAEFRLRAVRGRVANGESAPIDTIEALLEWQRRQVTRYESEAQFYVATLNVTAYLWNARGDAAPLPTQAKPVLDGIAGVGLDSARLEGLLATAAKRHPDLL